MVTLGYPLCPCPLSVNNDTLTLSPPVSFLNLFSTSPSLSQLSFPFALLPTSLRFSSTAPLHSVSIYLTNLYVWLFPLALNLNFPLVPLQPPTPALSCHLLSAAVGWMSLVRCCRSNQTLPSLFCVNPTPPSLESPEEHPLRLACKHSSDAVVSEVFIVILLKEATGNAELDLSCSINR